MTTRKRNEFLEVDLSDEDNRASNSEAEEESRAQRATKRRRTEVVEDLWDIDDVDEDEEKDGDDELLQGTDDHDLLDELPGSEEDIEGSPSQAQIARELHDSQVRESSAPASSLAGDHRSNADEQEDHLNDTETTHPPKTSIPTTKPSTKSILKPTPKPPLKPASPSKDKSGVLYLSRIPPFMKPSAVRSLLTQLGPINRIFLTPESPTSHRSRVRTGGNKKRSFTDGWVEFVHKRDAKICAEALNAKPIGGKKGGWYRDDVWNMRYLRGFKWRHLTEQIANENAERASRLRAEIAKTTRENSRFVGDVERAKMLGGMERKRKAKGEVEDDGEGGEGDGGVEEGARGLGDDGVGVGAAKKRKMPKQVFRQNAVKTKTNVVKEQPEEVKRVLSKIF